MDSIERYENKLHQTVNTILSLNGILEKKYDYSNSQIEILQAWLIGYYISDYEIFLQKNMLPYDRKNLQITTHLVSEGMTSISVEVLSLHKKFYLKYPDLGHLAPEELRVTTQSNQSDKLGLTIGVLFDKLEIGHFFILSKIMSSIKILYYELCIVQNAWSVSFFQDQVDHFYYEQHGPEIDLEATIEEMTSIVLNQLTSDDLYNSIR